MKYTKLLSQVGLASSLLSVSVGAFADVAATKVAPIQNIFPNAYADFEARNYQEIKDSNESVPKMQMRYTLGSQFFDEIPALKKKRLTSELIFGLNKYASKDAVEDRGTRWESELVLFNSTYVSLMSHLEAKLPHDGYGTNTTFGFRAPISTEISTGAGVVTPEVAADTYAFLGSRAKDVDVDVGPLDRELSDKEVKTLGVSQKDGEKGYTTSSEVTAFATEYTAKLTYVPNFVSGLTLYVKGYYSQTFNPVVQLAADQKSLEYKKTGNRTKYERVYSHEHRFNVLYDINKTLYVMNDFFLRDRNEAGRRQYENILALGAHLF